jgi:hypothetical protein
MENNNIVYTVLGGQRDNEWLDSVEYFKEKVWHLGPKMNSKRANMSTLVRSHFLWVFGGFNGEGTQADTFERIDIR